MPAKLNRVGQSSTSTGTGNFTLGGVLDVITGIRTFSEIAGSGDTAFLFFYSIIHKTLAEWEDGIGYIDGSGLLVRHRVFRSSNSNSIVNFSSGDKDVICSDQGNIQDVYFGGSPSTTVSTRWQVPNNQAGGSSTIATVANRLYAIPTIITNRLNITEWMISVTVLSAGASIYAALAERISRTEFRIVKDFGSVDASTTGDKVFPSGSGTIQAGSYFILVNTDGTPTVRGRNILFSDLGTAFAGANQWLYGSLSWSGSWPIPATGISNAVNNAAAPTVMYRTEDDYA
jgi:hypothetical protein